MPARAQSESSYKASAVSLRSFPYPYQAMLAIESDADHATLRKFNIIHEFLNTKSETPLGRGLGLDISDSFFLYNGSDIRGPIDYTGEKIGGEMTFFKGTTQQLNDGPIILRYIWAGWIDTFHSLGDFTRINPKSTPFSRKLAVSAFHYLQSHGVHLTVFTDHGNQSNVANFGAYGINRFENYQQGDNPSSPYFVTDLVRREGVRFVWADLYSDHYSYPSMLYPIALRDGRSMWGFWRFTGTLKIRHQKRLWKYDWTDLWNPDLLSKELSPDRLRSLIQSHGYSIIATHLEGNADKMPLSTSAVEALTRLSHMQDHGLILVARTSRLLQYNLVHQYLRYHTSSSRGKTAISVDYVADPVDGAFVPTINQLRGITFTVPTPHDTVLLLRGQKISPSDLVYSAHTIGVAWYPADTKNYAVWNLAQLQPQVAASAATVVTERDRWVSGILVAVIVGITGSSVWYRRWKRRR